MGREVVYCRLWTFHFCGLFVDPELLSQTGSRQRGAGRTQKFPILPSLSPSPPSFHSAKSPAQQGHKSGRQPGFLHWAQMLIISRSSIIFGGNPRDGGRWTPCRVWYGDNRWSWEHRAERMWSQGESCLLHSAGCWHAVIPAVGNWDLCGYRNVGTGMSH